LKETTVGQREDIEHGSPCAWGTEIRRMRNAAFEFARRLEASCNPKATD
jgi:hypothetical protein